MNAKDFSAALGEVGEKYVTEAVAYQKDSAKWRGRKSWRVAGAAAICLCLAAGGIGRYCYRLEHPYPVKHMVLDMLVSGEFVEEFCAVLWGRKSSLDEIYIIPHWEEMQIYEQYNTVPVGEQNYTARRGKVPKEQVGGKIGDTAAKGWDEYASLAGEDAVRCLDATLYEISGISPECAVAVRYAETDVYYSAVNSSYRPGTIGEFAAALDLQNTLEFRCAYYGYKKPISGEMVTICFENLDAARIWGILLANPAAVNQAKETVAGTQDTMMDIAVDVPLLGYKNISISVKEGGYIWTNILDTGKLFYIGEENTQAFVDYVLNECDGYEIVWIAGESVYPE